jgi:hypothetical protein
LGWSEAYLTRNILKSFVLFGNETKGAVYEIENRKY